MSKKERRESTSSESSETSNSSSTKEEDISPSNDNVLNKYTAAGDVANAVLKEVIGMIKEDAIVGDLCDHGDRRIVELTSKLFKKDTKILKGIAMPTCISVDNIVCHYSPLKSDPPLALKNGQVVKIDMGAHVDGFVGLAAHTVVVGQSKDSKVSGKKAQVIVAAHQCLEAALRCIHPSRNKNSFDITDVIDDICKAYDVKPIENMASHQIERYKITCEKHIIQNPTDDQKPKLEKFKFENYEVYAIDVLISTGDGKVKAGEQRTTVYKKTDDMIYSLRMKTSRSFLSEVSKKSQNLPFSLRNFDNENAAKMGLVECVNHGLITPYTVIVEKEGEFVAHFKATAVILPNGIFKSAGLPLDIENYDTDLRIEDVYISNLLKEQLKPKKKKKPAVSVTTATPPAGDKKVTSDKKSTSDKKLASNKK